MIPIRLQHTFIHLPQNLQSPVRTIHYVEYASASGVSCYGLGVTILIIEPTGHGW